MPVGACRQIGGRESNPRPPGLSALFFGAVGPCRRRKPKPCGENHDYLVLFDDFGYCGGRSRSQAVGGAGLGARRFHGADSRRISLDLRGEPGRGLQHFRGQTGLFCGGHSGDGGAVAVYGGQGIYPRLFWQVGHGLYHRRRFGQPDGSAVPGLCGGFIRFSADPFCYFQCGRRLHHHWRRHAGRLFYLFGRQKPGGERRWKSKN